MVEHALVERGFQELALRLDDLLASQQRLSVSVGELPNEEKPEAMAQQDQLIRGYMSLSRRVDPGLALALYIQKELWENFTDIDNLWKMNPWCGSEDFDYSFERYACARLDRQWVTISNWLQTAKVHFVEDHGPKEPITLIDPRTGQPLLEQVDGETKPITQTWDPYTKDFSKLLLANRVVREGSLSEEGWGLLANPKAGWSDIRDYIAGLKPWQRKRVGNTLSFFIQAGLLWASDGTRSEIVCELPMDSDSMLVRTAVSRMVRGLKISIRT